MDALEKLLEPIRHSPLLVEAAGCLNAQIAEERERREKFYDEMTPEQKVEFIDGEVVLDSPARNRHLDATKWLAMLLNTFVSVRGVGTVKVEKCLCVFPRNDYEPDIVFFGREKAEKLTPDTLKFPVPDLVIEVLSSSTEGRDRGVKFEDYATHGVGEYWIVDTVKECVEQYRQSAGEGYELVLKSSTGELRSEVIEGFAVPIRAMFDEEENVAALRKILAG